MKNNERSERQDEKKEEGNIYNKKEGIRNNTNNGK